MSQIRRVAIVLLAGGLITSMIYASGAFSSLGISRDASVRVTGDRTGYLSLEPGRNGAYTTYRNGELQLSLDGSGEGQNALRGEGLNQDATTQIASVFTITNQGSQTVAVWLSDTSELVTYVRADDQPLEGNASSVPLTPGEEIHVGVRFDTTDVTRTTLTTDLTVHAVADGTGGQSVSDSGPRDTTATDDRSPGNSTTPTPTSSDETHSQSTPDAGDASEQNQLNIDTERAVKALPLGFVLGNLGMPGGGFHVKESSSPLYLLGQVLNVALPPGFDILSDLRDIYSDVVVKQKFGWGTALNVLGVVPIIGKVNAPNDLRKAITNWMEAFPSQADEVASFLAKTFIKHLPDDVGSTLFGAMTDVPAKQLHKQGIPLGDIIHYHDAGVDVQRVLDLRSSNVAAEDIRYYVDEGIDLELVRTLRKEGLESKRIRFRLGDGAKSSISSLRTAGYDRREIVDLIDSGADLKTVESLSTRGFRKVEVKAFVRKGADLEAVRKLDDEGVPHADINYYVSNDMWLGGVIKMRKNGIPPKAAKWVIQKLEAAKDYNNIPKSIRSEINGKEIGGYTLSTYSIEVAKAVITHNSWRESRAGNNSTYSYL